MFSMAVGTNEGMVESGPFLVRGRQLIRGGGLAVFKNKFPGRQTP